VSKKIRTKILAQGDRRLIRLALKIEVDTENIVQIYGVAKKYGKHSGLIKNP